MAHTDPTTGEFIGEFEERDGEGNVTRRTEWFATEAEAKRFARTGEMPAPRCTAQITIPDGVMRGQRGQCMKKAVKGYEHCATHRQPWEHKKEGN